MGCAGRLVPHVFAALAGRAVARSRGRVVAGSRAGGHTASSRAGTGSGRDTGSSHRGNPRVARSTASRQAVEFVSYLLFGSTERLEVLGQRLDRLSVPVLVAVWVDENEWGVDRLVLIANSGGGCSPIWKPPRPDREALTVNSRVITFADRNKVSAGRSLRARPRPGPCSLAESRRGSQVKGGAIAPAHRASVGALEVRGAAFTRALPTPGDSRIREHAKPFAPTHRLSHSRSNDSRIRRRNQESAPPIRETCPRPKLRVF